MQVDLNDQESVWLLLNGGTGGIQIKTPRIMSSNAYPDLTVLRPLEQRIDDDIHPSRIIATDSPKNYYQYGWMNQEEATYSSLNIGSFIAFLILMAVICYLLAGTKLLKFIQFFITKKQYKRLNIRLQTDLQAISETPFEPGMHEKTPRLIGSASKGPTQLRQLLSEQQRHGAERNTLIGHLSYHSRCLIQFYAPSLAMVQMLSRCAKNVTLPGYIILWQFVLRITIIFIYAATICLIFMHTGLDAKISGCLLSHEVRATSFFCLNRGAEDQDLRVNNHQGTLYGLGLLASVLCAASMFFLSHSIFSGFTAYLDILISDSRQRRNSDPEALAKAPCKKQLFLATDDSPIVLNHRSSVQSPVAKKNLNEQSISSFRAFLDRENDISSYLPHLTNDSNCQDSSGLGHMSMSTQGGLLDRSDRQGFLNISSQGSARDLQCPSKRYPQTGAPDLLPIDEDVDDEKCSPIKPKRRTEHDSPFKKHFQERMSLRKSQLKPEVAQVDEKVDVVSKIAMNGLGIELDGVQNIDQEDMSSLNLNSGLLTTPRRICQSSQNNKSAAEINLQELLENELNADSFQLQVYKIPEIDAAKDNPPFESLKTLNSGKEGQREQKQRKTENMPSLQVNSFSNVDDSTLQLDTIAPLKNRVPSSTKNSMMETWQEKNKPDQDQNLNVYAQHPLSVRQANRPQDLVNLGLITPFHPTNSNNELQTDDRNSLGFGQMRNTVDLLSSDQISKNSYPIRADSESNHAIKQLQTRTLETLPEVTIGEQATIGNDLSTVRLVSIVTGIVVVAFSACIDTYFILTAADGGLSFIMTCSFAALIFDLILQLLLTIFLASIQFCRELSGRSLFLDTRKLDRLTSEAKEIAQQVFYKYEEQTAPLLIKVDADDNDEEKLLQHIEQTLGFEKNPALSNSNNQLTEISVKEIYFKESIIKLYLSGLCVEIRENLMFRLPQHLIEKKRAASMVNSVKPNLASPVDQVAISPNDEESQQRKRRRLNVESFERNQKFFATQAPIQHKNLRKRQVSSSKQSARLRQSIENVEPENIEGDFASRQGQRTGTKQNLTTPERIIKDAHRLSLADVPQTSNQKEGQFETPKISQIKLKHPSITMQPDCSDFDQNAYIESGDRGKDVQGKLSLGRSSNSEESKTKNKASERLPNSGRKYAEENYEDYAMMERVVGMILGNSSKSVSGFQSIESVQNSAPPRVSVEDVYQLKKDQQKGDSSNRFISANRRDQNPLVDNYSPVFSSVNRKEADQKCQLKSTAIQEKPYENEISSFGDQGNLPIKASQGRMSFRQVCSRNEMNSSATANITPSNKQETSASKLVQVIMTQREAIPKQHSFNSPNSLHEKLQMTNEKIQRSIEKSSLSKGRRKMVMLDEADIGKQTLRNEITKNNSVALTNSQQQQQLNQAFRRQGKSIDGSSDTVSRINEEPVLSNKSVKITEPMGLALGGVQQNMQVLLEDQSDLLMHQMLGTDLLQTKKDQDAPIEEEEAQEDYAQENEDDVVNDLIQIKSMVYNYVEGKMLRKTNTTLRNTNYTESGVFQDGLQLGKNLKAHNSPNQDSIQSCQVQNKSQIRQLEDFAVDPHPKKKKKGKKSSLGTGSGGEEEKKHKDYYLNMPAGSHRYDRYRGIGKGFKQRKKSQLIPKKEDSLVIKRRGNSKNSFNIRKVSASREHRNNSSREGTMSNFSIDFERMSKQREEDISEYSKLVSQAGMANRFEDQRRRLESFLCLAQQAKSKRDIDKIQSMIRQIDETGKPLPISRINELKFLELMASPYNQSLIAMIKVEFDMAKRVRDVKKVQNKVESSKSKFSLPKHLTAEPSLTQVINMAESQNDFLQPPSIVGGESDSRLAHVGFIRPTKVISSCRSNNDVAPGPFQQVSPLGRGLDQPVLSGKVRRESNAGRRDSSAANRYNYLRSVGNSVVVQKDVRKSVDRLRSCHDNDKNIKSKSDLDMLGTTHFEEVGRRGTAPTPLMQDVVRLPKSSLNYEKPDLAFPNDNKNLPSNQAKVDILVNQMQAAHKERSATSYGFTQNQALGTIMLGKNDFIKRIAAPQMQSRSAMTHNKENLRQSKQSRQIRKM